MNVFNWRPTEGGGNDIYVSIDYALSGMGMASDTTVHLDWGTWHPRETVSTPVLNWGIPQGFVIHLNYRGGGFPLIVTTNGTVVSVVQGQPPSTWNRNGYRQLNW